MTSSPLSLGHGSESGMTGGLQWRVSIGRRQSMGRDERGLDASRCGGKRRTDRPPSSPRERRSHAGVGVELMSCADLNSSVATFLSRNVQRDGSPCLHRDSSRVLWPLIRPTGARLRPPAASLERTIPGAATEAYRFAGIERRYPDLASGKSKNKIRLPLAILRWPLPISRQRIRRDYFHEHRDHRCCQDFRLP